MEPLSLEQLSLIKISVGFWKRREFRPYMTKQPNGMINLEQALPIIEARVNKYPISQILKSRLLNFVYRTGYELYTFLTKFVVKDSFETLHAQWTYRGLIDDIKTLRFYIDDVEPYTVSHFQMACTIFDEESVFTIWALLLDNERDAFRINCDVLFPAYWLHKMDDCMGNFPDDYASLIIGFNPYINLDINMFWHSVAVNNRNAVYYFYNKFTADELLSDKSFEQSLLIHIIESGRYEGFRFVMSYLEKPLVDDQIQQLIVNTCEREYLKNFIDFVLRHVNIFGDLHFRIFCYLLKQTSRKYAEIVRENLEIYALTLLSKGKLEKFEFISEFDAKDVLHRQVQERLINKFSLSIFSSIHFNKHTALLREFLDWLITNDDDKDLFDRFMNGLINGTLYSY